MIGKKGTKNSTNSNVGFVVRFPFSVHRCPLSVVRLLLFTVHRSPLAVHRQ